MFRRRTFLAASIAVPGTAMLSRAVAGADTTKSAGGFPTELVLPNGFQPEGIAIGPGPFAFFGSLYDGCILRYDLRTGVGEQINGGAGTPSRGLKTDQLNRLFVAGGTGGDGCVLSARTGAVLAAYLFATGTTQVNDVVVTSDAAWFTDSQNPVLYGLPLQDDRLPADFVRLPLSGDFVMADGINADGIASTPDGQALLVVQCNTGLLFRVDPRTGVARTVNLGGVLLTDGDGLLLDDSTLFVVQNRLNRIAVVKLNWSGTAGRVVEYLTDPRFDVPSTVAAFGNRLYLPNARLTTLPTPETSYNVIAVRR